MEGLCGASQLLYLTPYGGLPFSTIRTSAGMAGDRQEKGREGTEIKNFPRPGSSNAHSRRRFGMKKEKATERTIKRAIKEGGEAYLEPAAILT